MPNGYVIRIPPRVPSASIGAHSDKISKQSKYNAQSSEYFVKYLESYDLLLLLSLI